MSMIQVSKQGDKSLSFIHGLCCEPVLENACSRIQTSRCTLQAGAVWAPEQYAYQDQIQIFLFLNPTGYVRTDTQAFSINEASIFIPNFDREPFFIHAGGAELRCIRIVGNFNERDILEIGKSHLIFPRFRPLSQAWENTTYETTQPGANVNSSVLVERGKLGSYYMGRYCSAKPGASTLSGSCTPAFDQWLIALEGADYACTADEQTVALQGGDVAFVPRGTTFSSRCNNDGTLNYVWLMLNRAYDE